MARGQKEDKNKQKDGVINHHIEFVEDNRPNHLKKMEQPIPNRAVRNLGTYNLKQRGVNQKLPYFYDVEATSYYFQSKWEISARFFIIFSQLLILIPALIYVQSLAQIAAQSILALLQGLAGGFGGDLIIQNSWIVILLVVIFVIAWVSIFFLTMLPMFLTRTIRTVRIWTKIILIIGTINNGIVIAMGIAQLIYLQLNNPVISDTMITKIILLGLTGLASLCFTLGCWSLINNNKKYYRDVENKIAEQIRELRK
ncbi:hypothetical protein [Spiroplasma chrysopicola]|uniref:Transmembrane protein n=1 Tax=Spiroplasma chrysopicola DF-1 TaxID=1276227 RepID=R4U0R4_9MOLU|nr:hypothetical protein [Spiroplasma chrysopicola]AGM24867.1 hypothetical protein SCHRY_v1c02820 [Spiroplasma chrysopicola DF-1]